MAPAAIMLALWAMGPPPEAIAGPGAVPPPPEQYSADCARPVYATDHLVCADRALREMDQQLRDRVRARASPINSPFIEADGAWFKRRSLCAFANEHRPCVERAYAERLAVLDAMTTPAPAAALGVRCTVQGPDRLIRAKDVVTLFSAEGQPFAVALRDADPRWKPFASFVLSGRRLTLRTIEGRVAECRVPPPS